MTPSVVAAQVQALIARRKRDPIQHIRWLPLQYRFLCSTRKCRQIRCGNQTIGKTTPALAEVVGRCVGRHPIAGHSYPSPPVEAWVVCASWSQSLGIQKKLHDLLPYDEVNPRTHFDQINGFSPTKSPVVLFKNGSIIRIKTTGQDALDFAGATIDVILFDEPPRSSRLFTEALQRVQQRGGVVLLSYTPVNAPTDYLRALCEAGQIEDHWVPLRPEEMIPVGGTRPITTFDGRPKDQAWIDERRASVPEHERPVVIDGEWEMRSVDRYFSTFRNGGSASHVKAIDFEYDSIALGIDHGSRPGKQIAVLMLVRELDDGGVSIYVLDEYVDRAGTATPADDAAGVLAMLRRHHLAWTDLNSAYGDRVHMQGRAEQKSNKDLAVQIAKQLGRTIDQLTPGIRTAKRGAGRGAGSAETRSRWLYHRIVRDAFFVHPRCSRVLEALEKYTLRDDDYKDPIDAIVYGLDPYIFRAQSRANGPRVIVR